MKPSTLKPGMRVLLRPEFGESEELCATVVGRTARTCWRKAFTVIRVDDFANCSLNDTGEVQLSDYAVSRFLRPVEASSL